MRINDVINTLSKKQNGSFIKIAYMSDVSLTADAVKNGHVAHKVVITTIRKGINYANMKTTKAKLENISGSAEYAKVVNPMSWGKYVIGQEGLIIQHVPKNTGVLTYYLRAYTSPNKPCVQYFLDGNGVTRDTLEASGLVKGSYWNSAPGDGVMNIKLENIIEIY